MEEWNSGLLEPNIPISILQRSISSGRQLALTTAPVLMRIGADFELFFSRSTF